jgi:hypothetical protein
MQSLKESLNSLSTTWKRLLAADGKRCSKIPLMGAIGNSHTLRENYMVVGHPTNISVDDVKVKYTNVHLI